jgi:hypothetical protein
VGLDILHLGEWPSGNESNPSVRTNGP